MESPLHTTKMAQISPPERGSSAAVGVTKRSPTFANATFQQTLHIQCLWTGVQLVLEDGKRLRKLYGFGFWPSVISVVSRTDPPSLRPSHMLRWACLGLERVLL